MSKVQISSALHAQLDPLVQAGKSLDSLLEELLFEIPDEAMESFVLMAAPVEVEVRPETAELMGQIAEAFGMTPLGLTVLMHKVTERTFKVSQKYEEYKARGS